MILIALNCRGLGRSTALRSLKGITKKYHPDVLFLSEVKTNKETKIKHFLISLGFLDFKFVQPIGKSGGLILCWRNNLLIEVLNWSQHYINCLVRPNPPDPPWQLVGIYGPTKHHLKQDFWNKIEEIVVSSKGPALFIGDFNSILSQAEKNGGKPFVSSSSGGLQGVMDNQGLIDLGFSGNNFTWSNHREGYDHIRERLDRGIANIDWNLLFPKASITHLAAETSDHVPLLLRTSGQASFRPRPFRFEIMWDRDPACELIVRNAWSMRRGSTAAYRLLSALLLVQRKLKIWNRDHFGNCLKLTDILREKLAEIQLLPHSDTQLDMEKRLKLELEENLLRMEVMWKQKSRVEWLADGDANTRFFHLSTIINRSYNRINSIQDTFDVWITEPASIDICFVEFFKDQFTETSTSFPDDLGNLFQPTITQEENKNLCGIPSEEEIRVTIWSMGAQKSPGPDGMPPFFYKRYWPIIKEEVLAFVKQFFISRKLGGGINHTFLTLLKNKDRPSKPADYRPIALCNVSYKIITKILAGRLKLVLDRCIAENQSAFVPGRNINDNTIVSQEIMHYLHNSKSKQGYMAIKVDMEKAFDRVDWSCLIKIMRSSWIWQTICKNSEMIKKHTCFSIGNGENTHIWEDPWVPTLHGFKPGIEFKTPDSPVLVKELILASGGWDSLKLNNYFPREVSIEIKKVVIPPIMEPPTPFWIPSKSGDFTVKSAYLTVIERRLTSSHSTPRLVWKNLWSSKLHGRIKHLLWRIMCNSLPVKKRISFLIKNGEDQCVLCNNNVETLDHIFMECTVVKGILFKSRWGFKFPAEELSLKQWLINWFKNTHSGQKQDFRREEFLNFLLVTFDQVWKLRNMVIFQKVKPDFDVLYTTTISKVDDFWAAQVKKIVNDKRKSFDVTWIPPKQGTIKLNCDASVSGGKCCAAWIARNHIGETIAAFAECYPTISVDEAETRAFFEALNYGCHQQFSFTIESDSANTVTAFSDPKAQKDRLTHHWIKKGRDVCKTRVDFSFCKIPRSCNFVAHNLAKWASSKCWKGYIPLNVIPNYVFCTEGTIPLVVEPEINGN